MLNLASMKAQLEQLMKIIVGYQRDARINHPPLWPDQKHVILTMLDLSSRLIRNWVGAKPLVSRSGQDIKILWCCHQGQTHYTSIGQSEQKNKQGTQSILYQIFVGGLAPCFFPFHVVEEIVRKSDRTSEVDYYFTTSLSLRSGRKSPT